MELWPHQRRGLDELWANLQPGNSICVTSPTGGGKTRMMRETLKLGLRQILLTNRKMLLEQTAETLLADGIRFGIRAAGHVPELAEPIQLSSIQTEHSRTIKSDRWPLHDADVVHVDEAHNEKEGRAMELLARYKERGAIIVGWTATPLGIGHIYDRLIVAGTASELRETGALVAAVHYGPDEPDLARIKRTPTGEYKQADIVKAIMTHSIFGRVVEHWRRLNPEEKPTLLFAPGVAESLWFAQQLAGRGIPAAHIDGNDVWVDGNFYQSDQAARDELKDRCASGDIKIVCNRFVMREGIDWPFLHCGILATIFGALSSYLQSGGRLLRAYPGKTFAVIQDHGGNWHRHGSLNSDRSWSLDHSDYIVSETREERMRSRKEPEPICCPKCFALRLGGPKCPQCGHQHATRARMVVQVDGSLREMTGDIYKPRREYGKPDAEKKWLQYYFRAKKADMTFKQAMGFFAYENNWRWPARNLPMMPLDELDWFRKVKDVPYERLRTQHNRTFA
jgi:superfamily II DNA or RNA helicase